MNYSARINAEADRVTRLADMSPRMRRSRHDYAERVLRYSMRSRWPRIVVHVDLRN